MNNVSKYNFETIEYEENGKIAYISLNMPPANIMTPRFFEEISIVVKEYALKTKMSGIIISGSGRHFSSGADIRQLIDLAKSPASEIIQNDLADLAWYKKWREAFYCLSQIKKPVISVIRGLCIGSGFELALASNMRVCEENARVGLVESGFDLSPGLRGTIRMMEIVGYHKALELVLGGEILSAREALALGLVDIVVGKKQGHIYAQEYIIRGRQNECVYKNERSRIRVAGRSHSV